MTTRPAAWLARVAPSIELRRELDPATADFGPLQDAALWADPVMAGMSGSDVAELIRGAAAGPQTCLWVLRRRPDLETARIVLARTDIVDHAPETEQALLQILDTTRDPVLMAQMLRFPTAHPYAYATADTGAVTGAQHKEMVDALRSGLC